MGECLRCGGRTSLGGLCDTHAAAVGTCDDITAEQVITRDVDEPSVWLIDQWGATHALGDTAVVGRDSQSSDLTLLHHSVSALHAQIESSDSAAVRVVDRGSLNGTFVNGERARSANLFDGDLLRFGDVSFFFTTRPLPAIEHGGGTGRTVPSKQDDIAFVARIQAGADVIELLQHASGGVARSGDVELELAKLEFSLLMQLAARRRDKGDPALCFVTSQELAGALDFQSVAADSDNVRELVRRVRRKVKRAGWADLIESRQGAGYRLGWPVKSTRD